MLQKPKSIRWRVIPLIVITVLGGCDAPRAVPTQGPLGSLPGAVATLGEEFTRIGTVRELSDGRVLVSDEADNRLTVGDFATGVVEPRGGVGDGPGEYRGAGPLMPLPGDSTLMLDLRARRWLLLDGSEIVATIGSSDSAIAATAPGRVVGVAGEGKVFAIIYPSLGGGASSRADSLTLLRVDRITMQADSVARTSSAEQGATAVVVAGGGAAQAERRSYMMGIVPMDEVAVFPDGWVAIARVQPYRVDWCPPDERCRTGPALRVDPARTTEAVKAEYLRTAHSNASWPPTTVVEETSNWPETMPAFGSFSRRTYPSALTAVPDGRLLVQRIPTPDEPAMRYDVVARDGRIARRLELPINAQIVGASNRYLYVATTDELAIQRLSRHPWP